MRQTLAVRRERPVNRDAPPIQGIFTVWPMITE